jgi:hypothetical protein
MSAEQCMLTDEIIVTLFTLNKISETCSINIIRGSCELLISQFNSYYRRSRRNG